MRCPLSSLLAASSSLLAAGLLLLSPPAAAETIYLEATFDDKPIDEPLGAGGPTVGEPVHVDPYVTATVRATPMATPCVEIVDNDTYYAGVALFELLDSVEISEGQAVVSVVVWIPEQTSDCIFQLIVRERDGATLAFCDLLFTGTGEVYHSDANTLEQEIGTIALHSPVAVDIVFDMDARTCDVWLNDLLALDDEDVGVAGGGVGSVGLGCLHDPDLGDHFYVDELIVSDTFTPAPVAATTWGRVKQVLR